MKKKLVSVMLAGAMATLLLSGCGEKEETGENLLASVEDADVVLGQDEGVTPTITPEVTPTSAPEEMLAGTPAVTPTITPTSTPEATPMPEATPTTTPVVTSTPEATPTSVPAGISKQEAQQLLVSAYGLEDESTGNTNSFSYETTVTIDGVQYYNFRWSSYVDGHMTYLTNLAVATDGSGIYEVISEQNGNLKLVK